MRARELRATLVRWRVVPQRNTPCRSTPHLRYSSHILQHGRKMTTKASWMPVPSSHERRLAKPRARERDEPTLFGR